MWLLYDNPCGCLEKLQHFVVSQVKLNLLSVQSPLDCFTSTQYHWRWKTATSSSHGKTRIEFIRRTDAGRLKPISTEQRELWRYTTRIDCVMQHDHELCNHFQERKLKCKNSALSVTKYVLCVYICIDV